MYRGRFAPTPSGHLHFGSLVAAVGSYLEARQKGGEWLVRMEDLDTPRVVAGAADDILRTLEAFGFEWHGPVMWQSTRTGAYRSAFEQLQRSGNLYACVCSRSMQDGSGCVGSCRERSVSGESVRSWRLRAPKNVDDFVILRGDGIFAYQLAVVVDDAEQEITHVVRGGDLLDSTPKQTCLQRLLGYPTPDYLHLPVARNRAGEKLSKQTRAPAIGRTGLVNELADALRFLGQPLPNASGSLRELWAWATENWSAERMPCQAAASSASMAGVAVGLPRK